MSNDGYLGALVLLICGLLLIVRLYGRKEKFPPGPFAWPIIGHLHVVSHLPHQALRDVSKKYGHIVGLRLGQQRAVVVSSPELAKEVLLTHDKLFANRPPLKFTSELFYKNDMSFSFYGPDFTRKRKMCMVELFTAKRKKDLEYVRREELGLLLRSIQEASRGMKAVDFGRSVGAMSSRLFMRLLSSTATAEVAGENLQELITALEQLAFPTLGDVIPWLSCFDLLQKRRMRRVHARVDKVLSAILAERMQSASDRDDFLRTLLSKNVDLSTASSHDQETLTVHDIKGIMLDLLSAAIHTSSLTLEWAMAELLRKPNCVRRLRREIDSVVGKTEQITDADIAKLSYFKCIVKEVFRLHPVAPLLIPRISREECKVKGYILPENTLMMVNVWAMGRDEKLWANANEFMPERFEGKDMDVKGQHYELLPFGSGRRSCLGMPLALSVVEVTLANLVNSFDWELPYGQTHTSINMDEKHGIAINRASPLMTIPKPRVWPPS